MKKIFTVLYIFLGIFSFAQFQSNTFDENGGAHNHQSASEQNISSSAISADNSAQIANIGSAQMDEETPEMQNFGPGNPGEPVPIDDFLPLLFLLGIGMVWYYKRKINKVNL